MRTIRRGEALGRWGVGEEVVQGSGEEVSGEAFGGGVLLWETKGRLEYQRMYSTPDPCRMIMKNRATAIFRNCETESIYPATTDIDSTSYISGMQMENQCKGEKLRSLNTRGILPIRCLVQQTYQ